MLDNAGASRNRYVRTLPAATHTRTYVNTQPPFDVDHEPSLNNRDAPPVPRHTLNTEINSELNNVKHSEVRRWIVPNLDWELYYTLVVIP